MYKVLEIKEYAMTRDVIFKNIETGTIDKCFDDNFLTLKKDDFKFIEINHEYDCDIELFGSLLGDKIYGALYDYKIVNKEHFDNLFKHKIAVGLDIYFIIGNLDFAIGDIVQYDVTRKNLIQVDNVVHPRYI